MLTELTPLRLMVLGGTLLAASWLILLLVVVRSIPSSLLLSMGAYASSLAGLVVGLFGVAQYVRRVRP